MVYKAVVVFGHAENVVYLYKSPTKVIVSGSLTFTKKYLEHVVPWTRDRGSLLNSPVLLCAYMVDFRSTNWTICQCY